MPTHASWLRCSTGILDVDSVLRSSLPFPIESPSGKEHQRNEVDGTDADDEGGDEEELRPKGDQEDKKDDLDSEGRTGRVQQRGGGRSTRSPLVARMAS